METNAMANVIEMKAERREKGGKGAARRLRKAGRVPGVIYGGGKAPEMIHVNFVDLLKQVNTGTFESTLVDLDVDGEKVRAIPRDVQLDPVKDFPIHVDFLRVGKGTRITVEVPVEYVNEEQAPGLKRGGALNVVRHEVELYVDAENIPEKIVVDLTGLEIGDVVHISDVQLPEGAEPVIQDRDFTLATITGRAAETAEAEGEEAEGEEAEGGEEE
jgi:large subunit ribosomal protein L25